MSLIYVSSYPRYYKPYEPYTITINKDILCKLDDKNKQDIIDWFGLDIYGYSKKIYFMSLGWQDKDVLFYYIEAGLPFLIDNEDCQKYADYYREWLERTGLEISRISQVDFFIGLYQKGMKKVKRKHQGIMDFFTS